MRYRKLDADGDYSFGQGQANFWTNVPEAVGQAVKTRLLLIAGEWFLDVTEGTLYQQVLGRNTSPTRDLVLKNRMLKTAGVTALAAYASQLDGIRQFAVQARVDTVYGQTTVEVAQ